MPDLEGLEEFSEYWDSITGKRWSQFFLLSHFQKYGPKLPAPAGTITRVFPPGWRHAPGYNLIHMSEPQFTGMSINMLDNIANNIEMSHYPVLVEDRLAEPVFYEDVKWVPPPPEEALIHGTPGELVDIGRYEIDEYVNSMFMLTSAQLEDVSRIGGDPALAAFVEKGRKTIHTLNTAAWPGQIAGDADQALRMLVGVMLEGIEPPIAGREIYSKIKEKELNIDNFISTNLNNINIGAIPEYEQIPLGPGTPGATMSSATDWFSPPTVISDSVISVPASSVSDPGTADGIPDAGSVGGVFGGGGPVGGMYE
tara:strand:- start:4596 stop:5528 length:933 start_codon:yes stop_codon:yes gene_type:complete